jgi:hypothetical protein
LTNRSGATARTAAAIAARRGGQLAGGRRLHRPHRGAEQRPARRPVAHPGDLRLVGHDPVHHQAAVHGRLCERGGRRGRPHGRAPRSDPHAPAQRSPARVDVQAHASARRRRGQMRLAVGHQRHRSSRRCGQRAAVRARVGHDDVLHAVLVEPQRLGEREGQHAAEAGRQGALHERAAADGFRGQPHRLAPRQAQQIRRIGVERLQVHDRERRRQRSGRTPESIEVWEEKSVHRRIV